MSIVSARELAEANSAELPSGKTAEVANIYLDVNETLNRIIAEAIDVKTLVSRA